MNITVDFTPPQAIMLINAISDRGCPMTVKILGGQLVALLDELGHALPWRQHLAKLQWHPDKLANADWETKVEVWREIAEWESESNGR